MQAFDCSALLSAVYTADGGAHAAMQAPTARQRGASCSGQRRPPLPPRRMARGKSGSRLCHPWPRAGAAPRPRSATTIVLRSRREPRSTWISEISAPPSRHPHHLPRCPPCPRRPPCRCRGRRPLHTHSLPCRPPRPPPRCLERGNTPTPWLPSPRAPSPWVSPWSLPLPSPSVVHSAAPTAVHRRLAPRLSREATSARGASLSSMRRRVVRHLVTRRRV